MCKLKPVTHELFSGGAFALGDLVFVMRKHQIDSARVQIESLAEILHRHRGAFNVPTRTPAADGCFPSRFSLFPRSFPHTQIPPSFLSILSRAHPFPPSPHVP